jgi:hypothetical protein
MVERRKSKSKTLKRVYNPDILEEVDTKTGKHYYDSKPIKMKAAVKTIDAMSSPLSNTLSDIIQDYNKKLQANAEESQLRQTIKRIELKVDKLQLLIEKLELIIQRQQGTVPPMMFGTSVPPAYLDRNAIYKGPNKDKGQEFVRRNIAQILKNMIPPYAMDAMPKEVKEAYTNILKVMGEPNDPIWDKPAEADPREPWSMERTADYFNRIAEGQKKLDQIGNNNIIEEAVKAATEMFDQKEEEEEDINELQSDPSIPNNHDEKTKAHSTESDK